jgi:hypothetical protein
MSVKESYAFPLPSPYALQCTFINDNGDKATVTVVIAPTSFSQKDTFTWQVGWSCSRGRNCKCQECTYSYIKREQRGIK